jgi:hypothetical protein
MTHDADSDRTGVDVAVINVPAVCAIGVSAAGKLGHGAIEARAEAASKSIYGLGCPQAGPQPVVCKSSVARFCGGRAMGVFAGMTARIDAIAKAKLPREVPVRLRRKPQLHSHGSSPCGMPTFDEARATFEAAWRVYFQAWRDQRGRTRRKYAMWPRSERMFSTVTVRRATRAVPPSGRL